MEKKALFEKPKNCFLATQLKETASTIAPGRKSASCAKDQPERETKIRKVSAKNDKENVAHQTSDAAWPPKEDEKKKASIKIVASRLGRNDLFVDLKCPGISEWTNKENECKGAELHSFRESHEVNYPTDSTPSDSIQLDSSFPQNDQLEGMVIPETDLELCPDKVSLQSETSSNNRFLSDFDSIEKIGEGGFGRVFKARHKLLDEPFAIKIVCCKQNSLREVKALCRLSHDNIVQCFSCWLGNCGYDMDSSSDSSSSSGSPQNYSHKYLYIQMELCNGKTLRKWIDEQNKVKKVIVSERKKQSLNIIQQVVSGLEYIHLKEFIHRDLKPANILLDCTNQVKIGDFGLVTVNSDSMMDSMERTANKGTPSYMAPEQNNNRTYNHKVDIFAVGLIYFELLWKLSTCHERAMIWYDVRRQKLPQKFRATFFEENNILKPALEMKPDLRPEAADLKTDLENYSQRLCSLETSQSI